MKIMELVLQAQTATGLWINKYNLVNNSLSEVSTAALNIIESLGYDSGVPATPVANSVFDRYLEMAPGNFEFTQFYCRDIYNVNDFAQVNVAGVGWQGTRGTASFEAPFVVAKLKSTRSRQDIKAGYKALPPMLDGDTVSATGALGAPYLALMTALRTALADGTSPFVGLAQAFFGWAIVSKEEYTTPSGKKAYRYYPTAVEQAEHMAWPVTWTAIERVTSQNTRKFGRGR